MGGLSLQHNLTYPDWYTLGVEGDLGQDKSNKGMCMVIF